MIFKILCVLSAVCINVFSQNFKHTVIKKGIDDNNTMLLIGGIQGDEPGGFLAASLVATDYNITKGSVWVVPNLNFTSIISRSRGIKGDMNRKFQHIDSNDPDYEAVTAVKELISDNKVSLVLNLHDGSGFFREKFINKDKNPNKWGNTAIIDQSSLENGVYIDLYGVAKQVISGINQNLINEEHKYHIKNTKTAEGDEQMLKTLTYYAVTKGKSAFANEASKNLNAEQRAFYHLLAIEEYMGLMGIEFERPFELSVRNVKKAIEKPIKVGFFDKFNLILKNPRSEIKFVPFLKNESLQMSASNPITAAVKDGQGYKIQYGNRFMTRIVPQFFEYSDIVSKAKFYIDGEPKDVKLGDIIKVKESFEVEKIDSVRVNVIGYSAKTQDEAGYKITKKEISKTHSIDKAANIYRVEFYEILDADKFVGMILVEFER